MIKSAGVPITREYLAHSKKDAIQMANKIGYPVVIKGCGDNLTHKTEMGMVRIGISNDREAGRAYDDLTKKGIELDGILVQELVRETESLLSG